MPPRRRARRGRFPRCNQCRYPIAWFSFRGDWRPFDPKPVDGRQYPGTGAYPIEEKRAWHTVALVEELMGRLGITRDEAEEHVYAMPWHVLHACPPLTTKKESTRP